MAVCSVETFDTFEVSAVLRDSTNSYFNLLWLFFYESGLQRTGHQRSSCRDRLVEFSSYLSFYLASVIASVVSRLPRWKMLSSSFLLSTLL